MAHLMSGAFKRPWPGATAFEGPAAAEVFYPANPVDSKTGPG